ncbi:MAG: GNAT family N-acetyltransferase [Candidatus Verstraetearchaeota archaeon]|nr:GNAT family N-acetyltransferase [Candidatus Verstraetearchaeota archaeon]
MRTAERGDFGNLVSMTSVEGWGYREEDFGWFEKVGGRTLLAVEGREIIGMVTLFDYGDTGWISNLLVKCEERRRGVGTALLDECMRRFSEKRTIALFAYEHTVGFYEDHGFKRESDAHIASLGAAQTEKWQAGRAMEVTEEMVEFDRECFGFTRPALLKGLSEIGEVLVPVKGRGFAIVRPDPIEPRAGPVVASDRKGGTELLCSALSAAGPSAKALVTGEGFEALKYEGKISRLYQGDPPKIDRNRAFAFAGPELG